MDVPHPQITVDYESIPMWWRHIGNSIVKNAHALFDVVGRCFHSISFRNYSTKGTVWSNSVAQYFKNFGVFLHECHTLSQPEPADESVGVSHRFMTKKSIEGVVRWVCQLVKKLDS